MVSTDVVDSIVAALDESQEGPRKKIAEIVQAVGETAALEILERTRQIEESGGELVKKGSRKRTAGGIFFRLAKAEVPLEARRQIFRSPHKPKPKPEPGVADKPAPAPQRPAAAPERGGAPAGLASASAAARPRRRVIELGTIRQAEPPKPAPPVAASRPTSATPKMVWTKPSQARVGVASRPAEHHAERATAQATARATASEEPAPLKRAEALSQVRSIVARVSKDDAVAVLLEVLRELGYEPKPESSRRPLDTEAEVDDASERAADSTEQRERILTAVVDALGLSARQLATVLYRSDSPSSVRKAEQALRKFRASE